MPDSSDVDAALSAKLLADAALLALLPDGVFFDIARKGATRFVIISLMAHEDTYQFQGSAWERFVYLIKAVAFGTGATAAGVNVKDAAARIHTLLQDGTLTVNGYGLMVMQRIERVRFTEVDELNDDARWHHRGGQYEVLVSPS